MVKQGCLSQCKSVATCSGGKGRECYHEVRGALC